MTSSTADYWRVRDDVRELVRVPRRPRGTYFNPFVSTTILDCPFTIDQLEDERTTRLVKLGTTTVEEINDSTWKAEDSMTKKSIGFKFMGETIFKIKTDVQIIPP